MFSQVRDGVGCDNRALTSECARLFNKVDHDVKIDSAHTTKFSWTLEDCRCVLKFFREDGPYADDLDKIEAHVFREVEAQYPGLGYSCDAEHKLDHRSRHFEITAIVCKIDKF